MLSAGGLDIILSVMSVHAGNERVQETACLALANIAFAVGPPTKPVIWSSSAVELVASACRKYPDDVALVAAARLAMQDLKPGSDADPAVVERHQRLVTECSSVSDNGSALQFASDNWWLTQ